MNSSNVTDCQIDDLADTMIREIHQDKGLEWSFLGGIHFCLTVVSTIGKLRELALIYVVCVVWRTKYI